MKNIRIYCCVLILLYACDVLDKEPLDVISGAAVWGDKALMNAHLTNAYVKMYILDNETPEHFEDPANGQHNSVIWNGPFAINELSDESRRGNFIHGSSNAKFFGITSGGGVLEWWEKAYVVNRILNEFIEEVPKTNVDEDYKKVRVAEARFLRAYNYFAMVKRYGGVPIITRAQSIGDPEEELFRKRDSEEDVYDFVIQELEEIADDLPGRAGTELGRPSRMAAWALLSRVALYAGSIAQYGTPQLNGLLGINESPSLYYQKAFDAAEKVINSGEYGLLDAGTDKVQNFKNIFLTKNTIEDIWFKQHNTLDPRRGGNAWSWDFFQCPKPHSWNSGNQNAPYLETAEWFEYIDGRPGTLDRNMIRNTRFTNSYVDLWEGKDPRFYATLYTQGTQWKGTTVDYQYGMLIPTGEILFSGSYEGELVQGTARNMAVTSFGVMKYLDESHDNMTGIMATSDTDFKLIRYAEVLLNYAEAGFELGKTAESLAAVNLIRKRAGIQELSTIDRQRIRDERKVELAFEGHRYWDLRRWRIARDVLTVNRTGFLFFLVYETREYIIQVLDKVDGTTDPIFLEHNYYFPITHARIGNNPNLVENPGYE